jgi:hypothetical protein
MTSKENVKNLVKSNMCRTMGGQGMSIRRIDTYACMPLKKTFKDCAEETKGGKSKLEEKTAKRINPTVAKPNTSGNWLAGHGKHFKFSM